MFFCGVLLGLLPVSLGGADRTWDGGSIYNSNWANQANWDAPIAENDALFFAGSTRVTPINNTVAGTNYNSITFNDAASSFTLSGNRIDLNPNGAVANNSANSQTVNLAIRLLANGAITSNGGLLTISGTIDEDGDAAKLLTFGGAGNITVSGAIASTLNGNDLGIVKNGAGTLTLSGANTYDGLTTVSAGTLAYGASNVINTGGITVNGATAVLAMGNNQSDSVGTVTLAGGGSITGTGTSTLTSTGSFEMQSGSVSAALGGSGINLNKTTSGTVFLSGANTYTGVTTFESGIVNAATLSDYGVAGSLGQRAVDVNPPTSAVGLRFMGGTLQYTGATAQSTNRDIRVGLPGGTIDASGSVPSATMSFTKSTPNVDIWDTDGARTLTLTGTNTGDNLFAINWQEREAGRSSLVKSGTGTWVLTNPHNSDAQTNAYNTYGGYGGGTVISGGTLGFASGAIGGDVVDFTGNATLRWESGNTQDITTGTGAGIARSVKIEDGVTATFNTNGNNVTLSNALAVGTLKTGALTKDGAGTLTLTGTNTYTGDTTVSAGTLLVNGVIASTANPSFGVTVGDGTGIDVLGGSGTVLGATKFNGGSDTTTNYSLHDPGNNGVGIQTFSDDLTYNAGSQIKWELRGNTEDGPGTNFDRIYVGGDLDFAGATTLKLDFSTVPGSEGSVNWNDPFWGMWTIHEWQIWGVTGATTGPLPTISLANSGYDSAGVAFSPGDNVSSTATFSLFQDGGNVYLRYAAMPEPASWSVLALALALATMGARRRRRLGDGPVSAA